MSPSMPNRAMILGYRAHRSLLTLAVLAALCRPVELPAQDRLVRRFAEESGLIAPPVWALVQDSAGFLWIGSEAGLFRFDGTEFRRWAPETIRDGIWMLCVSPAGTVIAVGTANTFAITAGGTRPIPLPGNVWPDSHSPVAFDSEGRLWAIRDSAVWHSDSLQQRWMTVRSLWTGEDARRLYRHPRKGVILATNRAVWHLRAGATPTRVLDIPSVVDFLALPDDRLILLTFGGRVVEVGGGKVREMVPAWTLAPGRAISLAIRHGTLWISLDRYLVALRPGEPPEVLGPEDGIESGGPLLVDHEGSLWMGSFTGLFQYPEPETRIWNDRHGLPSQHTRFLTRADDVLWVTTWQGTGTLRRGEAGWEAATVSSWLSKYRLCADGNGGLWTSSERGMADVHGNTEYRWHADFPLQILGCSLDPAGGVWMAGLQGLIHAEARNGSLHWVKSLPFPPASELTAVLHDRAGWLWLASDERICHAFASDVRIGGGDWSCDTVPGIGHVSNFLELPDGGLWAGTSQAGVITNRGGHWEVLEPSNQLPTRTVFRLIPSRSGGIWVVGHGFVQRVRPDSSGWIEVERPGAWHGLASSGASDLVEDADGTLWIATSLGVVQVPPEARFARPPTPRVSLVDVRAAGRPIRLDGGIELAHDRNRLELRFAALSFRDRGRLRYQVRLSPGEEWTDVRGLPSFRWVDLRPGRYLAQVRASLDGGQTWSPEPAQVSFAVLPPWYREPWAIALFALAGITLLWAAYRTRVAYLLGLERQRTRIAMDLHDEVGSGLASIGILSGVLAADGMNGAESGRMAREIATTAEELGHSLSDIVWSLDPHVATLEELASRLAEHAERLFAEGGVEFSVEFPAAWPAGLLPLPVRRNLLLIGLEALHNTARHANAGEVILSLRPRGRSWELSVRDDGMGLPDDRGDVDQRGHGLRGMQRRAVEIGAELGIESAPGQGTAVTLRFALKPGPGRPPPGLPRWMPRIAR